MSLRLSSDSISLSLNAPSAADVWQGIIGRAEEWPRVSYFRNYFEDSSWSGGLAWLSMGE